MKVLLDVRNTEPKSYTFSDKTLLTRNFFAKAMRCEPDEISFIHIHKSSETPVDLFDLKHQVEDPIAVVCKYYPLGVYVSNAGQMQDNTIYPRNFTLSKVCNLIVYGPGFIVDKRLLSSDIYPEIKVP